MTKSKVQRKICKVRGCRTPWDTKKWQLCVKHRKETRVVLPLECTVADCPNPVTQPGMCGTHKYAEYQQLQPEVLDKIEMMLLPWIEPSEDGCWLFVHEKMINKDGYGRFLPNGKFALVHRWMWMHLVGPIPDAHHLHHSCTVRNCCRPGHLTPVTPEEHNRLTADDVVFRLQYPDEEITGPDRSHTDRERRFALVYGLPADSVLTTEDIEGIQIDQA